MTDQQALEGIRAARLAGERQRDADALREFITEYCRESPETELKFYRDCANGFNARRVKDWLAPGLDGLALRHLSD